MENRNAGALVGRRATGSEPAPLLAGGPKPSPAEQHEKPHHRTKARHLMPTMEDIKSWRGHEARSSDGDKLGKIDDIYLDQETGKPEWIAVRTGLFGGHVSFGPLAEARLDGDAVAVAYDKAKVRDAAHADADGELSQQWRRRT
jgi:sporulation protein YlmC with PRC-barrel domain